MKTKLKQVIVATINSCDMDTRLVLRDISRTMLRSYTLTQVLDVLTSKKTTEDMIVGMVSKLFSIALDSDLNIIPLEKDGSYFKIIDALNLFWLHVLEDYSIEELNKYIDLLFSSYLESLIGRRLVVSKETKDRLQLIKNSMTLKALVIVCVFSVDIGSILTRGELPDEENQ